MIRFFTENWALKIAALALAILLWLAVRANSPRRATFPSVPVTVDLRDPDWRLASRPDPAHVTVWVTGPMSELMRVSRSGLRVVLPVDRVSDSTQAQVVPTHWIQFPSGVDRTQVNVESLRPDTIRLQYERLDSRTLPLHVRTRGDLPQGVALALPIETNPSTVQVRGPRRVLEDLDSIPLHPVDLSGLRRSTNVPTQVDTSALPGLSISPTDINVILRVAPPDSQPGLRETQTARRPVSNRRPIR